MSAEPGLRERKKQRTRETIARVAVELFEERGYEATTVADIAEAADVSARTIFSYFPSKEAIFFCDFPALKAELVRALEGRPEDKDTLETVRDFILSAGSHLVDDDLHRRRERIVEADDTLRSHKRARLGEIEEVVATAIAGELDGGADDLRPRLVAASLIAAFEAFDDRRELGAVTPGDVATKIDPVFTFLRGGLDALSSSQGTTRHRRKGASSP
jgi:AcrR family transcriptional regulator